MITAFALQGCQLEDETIELPVIEDPGTGIWYVGKLTTAGDARFVRGYTINKTQYAFIAAGRNGFNIANVTDGASPSLTANYNTGGFVTEIYIDSVNGRHFAFLSDNEKGLLVFDVTTPQTPSFIDLVSYQNLTSVNRKDSILYAATASGLKMLNINQLPDTLIDAGTYTPADYIKHIEISGNLCCLVESTAGLEFLNITNPSSPVFNSTFKTPGSCLDIKIAGNLGYVADGNSGISVISVSNPAQPYFVRTVSTETDVRKLDYSPNFLFTAENTDGTSVFNLFDTSKPDFIGYYEPEGVTYSVHFYKAKILLANGANGLLILRF